MNDAPDDKLTVGWREWIALPDLGIARIKAKVDTGARTSALHATNIREYREDDRARVAFEVQPRKRKPGEPVSCHADIVDRRIVANSGGYKEERYVIETRLSIGTYSWPIEITLTSRDDMLIRMLLGRTAIESRAVVDPSRSYLVGKRLRKKKKQ